MSQKEIPFEIPKRNRSPSGASPKVLYSVASPNKHKYLKGLPEGSKSSREEIEIDEHLMPIFGFAGFVLAKSISEGPQGRREILFQENDEMSPVKQARVFKKEAAEKTESFMHLQEFSSCPVLTEPIETQESQEVRIPTQQSMKEVKESGKSPNHAALTSLLTMILKEQEDNEGREKSRGKSRELPEKSGKLSTNLVNKFTGLQKNSSHNSLNTSLHERSFSNLLSQDRTAHQSGFSSRINTEPPSKVPSKTHSRVGSWAKVQINTQADIIWETTEIESATRSHRRTSRLSADYTPLMNKYQQASPIHKHIAATQQATPNLSPKHRLAEGFTPVKKSTFAGAKQSSYRSFTGRAKHLQKLFPNKPQQLEVKTTLARWPVKQVTEGN